MKKIRYYKFTKLEKIAMNCKLEKFWNLRIAGSSIFTGSWTVNLKSFEICMAGVSAGLTLDEL